MFKITTDHTWEEGDETNAAGRVVENMPLYGMERVMGVDDSLPEAENLIPFRLYDDDGELMLSGQLHDDPDCINQSAALRYGESYAGCTYILVKRNTAWLQDVG